MPSAGDEEKEVGGCTGGFHCSGQVGLFVRNANAMQVNGMDSLRRSRGTRASSHKDLFYFVTSGFSFMARDRSRLCRYAFVFCIRPRYQWYDQPDLSACNLPQLNALSTATEPP